MAFARYVEGKMKRRSIFCRATLQHKTFGVVVLQSYKKSVGVGNTFAYVVEEMIGRCDLVDIEILAVVPQKIWFQRNFIVHGGDFTHPSQVFQEASTSLEEFRRIIAQDIVA